MMGTAFLRSEHILDASVLCFEFTYLFSCGRLRVFEDIWTEEG
jgi:hypothetical protein